MPRNKNSPPPTPPDDEAKRGGSEDLARALTAKQKLFADTLLLNGMNASAAARVAKYKSASEGWRTLGLEAVQKYLQSVLNELGYGKEHIRRRLEYFAGGDMQDFLRIAPSERSYWERADQSEVIREAAKKRGLSASAFDIEDISGIVGADSVAQTEDGVLMVRVRTLDAEVVVDWRAAEKAHALGRIKKIKIGKDGSAEFELHDPVKTLELLGKAQKMFTEKHEFSGPDGEPLKLYACLDPEHV